MDILLAHGYFIAEDAHEQGMFIMLGYDAAFTHSPLGHLLRPPP
ncbi:MAG: hypothetical protein R6X32_16095 [Chloroflexota bacterium]